MVTRAWVIVALLLLCFPPAPPGHRSLAYAGLLIPRGTLRQTRASLHIAFTTSVMGLSASFTDLEWLDDFPPLPASSHPHPPTFPPELDGIISQLEAMVNGFELGPKAL